ncbi:helix-turn-helix transcriptional regulator [Actinoplanes regularis]|uniref:helix-turn-helix transcriptional regulator n=1 Tax=Actinoplanes regularis TaxID=52697 RepID=UPI0024A356BB|nr:hypothetical protein [Actinoplanes regularis]GLW32976.1 hypothetical protein Areg01_59140 [Actinoplanes regularis]
MTHIFGPDIRLRFNGASLEYDFDGEGRESDPGYITTIRIGVAFQANPSPLLKPLDLVGSAEIKKMLGVGRQRAYQLTCSHDFPTPAASLDGGKVWLRSEVQEWIEVNRPSTSEHPDDQKPVDQSDRYA